MDECSEELEVVDIDNTGDCESVFLYLSDGSVAVFYPAQWGAVFTGEVDRD